MTLDSRTLGSMHICVSWLRETRVQLVTAPPTYGPLAASSRITRSSTAVALKSLMFGAWQRGDASQSVRALMRSPSVGLDTQVISDQTSFSSQNQCEDQSSHHRLLQRSSCTALPPPHLESPMICRKKDLPTSASQNPIFPKYHLQNLGQQGRCEEGCMLDDDIVAFILIGH